MPSESGAPPAYGAREGPFSMGMCVSFVGEAPWSDRLTTPRVRPHPRIKCGQALTFPIEGEEQAERRPEAL